MISAIFILNGIGNVIISRVFREDVKYSVIEIFHTKIINVNPQDLKNPILTLGSTTFLYIKKGDIYYVAVTRNNSDASVILQYLNRLINMLKSLISVTTNHIVNDTELMDNFLLIYEILDLTIDQGFVRQIDESLIMSKIYSPITKSMDSDKKLNISSDLKIIKKDISLIEPLDTNILVEKYDKNVILLLLNEYLYVSDKKAKILGEVISVSTVPSGLTIDFQFNTPVTDYSSIELKSLNIAPIESLIKPSSKITNKFNLSSRISTSVQPILNYSAELLFDDLPIIILGSYKQIANNKFELQITLELRFSSDIFAKDIKVNIPIPKNVLKIIDVYDACAENIGRNEEISQSDEYLVWSLKSISGTKKLKLNKIIYTDSSTLKLSDWISTRRNVQVIFDIPKYSLTKYHINSFNVEKEFDNIATRLIQFHTLSHSTYEFYV
ncbi:hypothetical protein C6P40_003793 [Pichia californica]|uniref:MHD domain-containing protein n=1 Tax=Pichia californica TaxID=460514 RepID=A0A9P6WGL2_9ASCO|nr:hypothetical protein C6P40_003793 [[Candida] californica]